MRGTSAAQDLRRSSAAITVVETAEARKGTADLGDVLARSEGVGIQRSGGLGGNTRLSLNGFSDNQVRIFVDGVPINMSGFGLGTGSIPIEFLDRVEIYQGVVPIEFGADALGGAVNLVTRQQPRGTGGSVSLQAGSFGTYRLTGGVRHAFGDTGLEAVRCSPDQVLPSRRTGISNAGS